jgi:hypothetical protein
LLSESCPSPSTTSRSLQTFKLAYRRVISRLLWPSAADIRSSETPALSA